MKSNNAIPLLRPSAAALLAVLAIPLLFGCTLHPGIAAVPPAEVSPGSASPSVEPSAIQVWFTDPEGSRPGEEPVAAILSSIGSARRTIDLAIYNLNDPRISIALLRARENGVEVRIVMEGDNLEKEIPRRLLAADIPVRVDEKGSLMHNKFMIVDEAVLLTGSANYTENGLGLDNNYLIRLEDPRLAKVYLDEFNSMFEGGQFGSDDLQSSGVKPFEIEGSTVEVLFSPEDQVEEKLLSLAGEADTSIHFLAYTFTLDKLGQALTDKYRSGVEVRGVFEGEMLPGSTGTEYDRFRRAGMDIRLDGNPGLMHEKLMIFDGEIIVIGSYNFTRTADERNDENLLVIHDAALAGRFEQEFKRVFESAKP
jgi:phosphatidylserine/phosphatidylglycerophosphate/cardiolipin synthase-like enzyme